MLKNLAAWLDKAAELAKEKEFPADRWLELRLAPDMYPLLRQVQSACDAAKFVAARLADITPPKHEDNEKTFEEIKARIDATMEFLDSVDAAKLEGAADRKLVLPFLPEGKWVRGEDYLAEFALPNFYFHIVTAYDILRHNGVALGKRDFIGSMPIQD